MFNWNKKEAPLLGLLGSGGGLRYLAGGISVPDVGSQLFETAGTFTWTVPAQAAASGIDIVVIGGGGGCSLYPSNITGGSGGGGARLSFINNQSVSAGQELTITVGAGGRGSFGGPDGVPAPVQPLVTSGNSAEDGGYSSVRNPGQPASSSNSIIYAGGGGGAPGPAGGSGGTAQWNSHGGGNGGDGGSQGGNSSYWSFGGGAGGYGVPSANGTGGNGGRWEAGVPPGYYSHGASAGASNSGAAGGAAMWGNRTGVGVFGKGPTGAINSPGSGGTSSKYGGGGSTAGSGAAGASQVGQPGAVRIIWGPGRQFPDTGTGLDGGPAPS